MKNKKILNILLFLLLGIVFLSSNFFKINSKELDNITNVHYFYQEGCSACGEMSSFLNDLEEEIDFNITKYNISNSNENLTLFYKVNSLFEYNQSFVPLIVIGGSSYQGVNDDLKTTIKNKIISNNNNPWEYDVVEMLKNNQEVTKSHLEGIDLDQSVKIPFLKRMKISEISLVLGAILIGLADGFNPCAMWALFFLINLLIKNKDRKKLTILGLTFILTSGVFYFLILTTLVHTSFIFTGKFWFRLIVGLFAIISGGYSLFKIIKSLKKDQGCQVIKQENKNKFLEKIKKIVNEKKHLVAIISIILIAIGVNVIELGCSAGWPTIFAQLLVINNVSKGMSYLYSFLYVLFFLIDDIIIFFIALFTFKAKGISNKAANIISLIGSIFMLILGILMIFFPGVLSISG